MADWFLSLGLDELAVPAFFDTGDAAATERLKREHPDWFVAGTWTPGQPRRTPSAIEARSLFPSTGRLPGEADAWSGRMAPQPIDPASLSVADFQRVAAAARTQGGPDHPEIIQAQYRGPARAVPRFQGPPRTPREEYLEFRYYDVLRTLRRLEPRSPESDQLRDPARAPSKNTVRRLEQEARDALARNAARAPAGPGEPDPATPLQREDLRREMVREGFMVDQGGYAAHHIIPGGAAMSGGRDPARAQEFLRDYRIDLDSALNGVALSRRFHDRLHTKTYYEYVENGLRSAGSREGVIAFLRRLARRLKMEDLRFQKDELMPTWKE